MSVPASCNVTGRRKRNAVIDDDDEDDDSLTRSTPLRKVRGNKRINQQNVAPSSIMETVNTHVDDIINKKKVGTLNCFEFKSPLELFGIEEMIEAKASIHEMAIVLDGANQVIAYRLDRLLNDVRAVDTALCNGEVIRGPEGDQNVAIKVDSRRLKKNMNIADGMSTMGAFLETMAIDEADREERERLNLDEDDEIAGETRPDPKANSRDVDYFLKNNIIIEDLVRTISVKRANEFKAALNNNVSRFVSADDTVHDIKDTSVDWLRSNPTFQKATKGSLDNTCNSFHSLNYYGMHSPSGRALILHPRIVEKSNDDYFFPSDVSASLAKNTCGLLINALEKKPKVLDNYLMLEVKDRPVVGRYKIMGRETKKSTLPLAEAAREKDLANLTFAEMNRPVTADTTIAGSSDMSMLPGQGLPLTRGAMDQTIVLGSANSILNRTVSASNKLANEEYIPPSIESLNLEESLIGRVELNPIDSEELDKIFEEKYMAMKTSDAMETKLWKNGMRAEEWGENDEARMKTDTRNAVLAGVEGWIKATDAWTNYDVVKMIVNREARMQLDEAFDEQDQKLFPPDVGKSYFLVKSDQYLNSYPVDRHVEMKMFEEELDVMKMFEDENGQSAPLQQIRDEIRVQQQQAEDELNRDPDANMPFEDREDYDMDFDHDLAAPIEIANDGPINDNDDNGAAADIIFNDDIGDDTHGANAEQDNQRAIEAAALGDGELAELMTTEAPPQLVEPTAEMREEIRNVGKADNAHWVPPEIADQEKQAAVLAQRKRREKKSKKKATIEDFLGYFRDIPDDELEREMTISKCAKTNDEKSTFLSEQQLYLPSLGIENKPHVAFEMGVLSNSGLFFKKSYGKIRLERTKPQTAEEDIFIEDSKATSSSDCLNWLMTFNGFKCMENLDPIEDPSNEEEIQDYHPQDDYVNDIYEEDFDPRHYQEAAQDQMGTPLQRRFEVASSQIHQMYTRIHPKYDGEYGDSEDEFDDSIDRHSVQARNLDAAKHKKCLADILRCEKLSMPSIQYALETLTITNQTMRRNDTILGAGTSDESARPSTPSFEADKTLTSVFEYHTPKKLNVSVHDVMKALTELPDYQEVPPSTSDDQPTTSSSYGTANTENRKVEIKGLHTLLSLSLSMPTRMGEVVRPSSIVSFLLHIANENSLQIVQDRSKRSWMSDFVVLNHSEGLPREFKMGKIEEQGDFWRRTQDPDAIELNSIDTNSVFTSLMARPKAVPIRKGKQNLPSTSSAPLQDISEGEEQMEEE